MLKVNPVNQNRMKMYYKRYHKPSIEHELNNTV